MRPHPVASAVLALVALSACTQPAPLPATQAVAHYDAVMVEVRAALAQAGVALPEQADQRTVATVEGQCRYAPGVYAPTPAAPTRKLFDEPGWPAAQQVLSEALVKHGFAALDKPTQREAVRLFVTTDSHGATLQIDQTGRTNLYRVLVDAMPCSPATLGLS